MLLSLQREWTDVNTEKWRRQLLCKSYLIQFLFFLFVNQFDSNFGDHCPYKSLCPLNPHSVWHFHISFCLVSYTLISFVHSCLIFQVSLLYRFLLELLNYISSGHKVLVLLFICRNAFPLLLCNHPLRGEDFLDEPDEHSRKFDRRLFEVLDRNNNVSRHWL